MNTETVELSESLAKIRSAFSAVAEWRPGDEPWPAAAVDDALAAVVDLANGYAVIGKASDRLSSRTASMTAMIATTKLDCLAGRAKTDPEERLRFVASLGILATELVGMAADIGAKGSRAQQTKAGKPRNVSEVDQQIDMAAKVFREGRLDSPAAIAREVGRRLYDEPGKVWPCKAEAIAERLRRQPERWRDGR